MNSIQLLGRLGKDPERKGDSLVVASLATSTKYNGEEKTQWHNLKAFKGTADVMDKYFKKGDMMACEGTVEYNEYEGKWYTSVIVNKVHFVGGKSNGDTAKPATAKEDAFDDDIPF
tara:strand:- start:710 stop:1057 length:348 start_codon:yes stop_codon:yes gene_type:complete